MRAVRWSAEEIVEDLSQVEHEKYPQVRAEVERILGVVNEKRRAAGLPLVMLSGSSEVIH